MSVGFLMTLGFLTTQNAGPAPDIQNFPAVTNKALSPYFCRHIYCVGPLSCPHPGTHRYCHVSRKVRYCCNATSGVNRVRASSLHISWARTRRLVIFLCTLGGKWSMLPCLSNAS
jgi:hypothetical protein